MRGLMMTAVAGVALGLVLPTTANCTSSSSASGDATAQGGGGGSGGTAASGGGAEEGGNDPAGQGGTGGSGGTAALGGGGMGDGGDGGTGNALCGNGIWEPAFGEECDDANADQCDGCFDNCKTGAVLLEPVYDATDNILTTMMTNCETVAGVEYYVSGTVLVDQCDSDACPNDGGLVMPSQHNWTVAWNMNNPGHMLAFHTTGNHIPASSSAQPLLEMIVTPNPGATEVCFIDDLTLIIADPNGDAIEAASGGCVPL